MLNFNGDLRKARKGKPSGNVGGAKPRVLKNTNIQFGVCRLTLKRRLINGIAGLPKLIGSSVFFDYDSREGKI